MKYFGRHSSVCSVCIAANLIYTRLKLHNDYHYVYGMYWVCDYLMHQWRLHNTIFSHIAYEGDNLQHILAM